jgi:hypothetical protein
MLLKANSRVEEQRAEQRSSIDLPIALSYFRTSKDFPLFEARACNQSINGLCLHTQEKLCEKMIVFIRQLAGIPAPNPPQALLRNSIVAEVRWCRPMETRKGEYVAGVKYF